MQFLPDDWSGIFAPETPVLELIARGSVLYLGILALMRVLPRRTGGELANMDLIFVLLLAEAAAHSIGDYSSVADGFIVIMTLLALNYAVNALSYYMPFIERLVSARPLQVVRDGETLPRNMRREFLTEEELMSYLRQNGMDDLSDVKIAFVESEGKLSIVPVKE